MPSPRLLVIEGNSPQTMAEHVAAGGVPGKPSAVYAAADNGEIEVSHA